MSIDARTEKFEHIELFGKPALFTNGRVNRDTVPDGWHRYDFRGSDSNPGKLNCVELHVGVNHSGAVLLPEEIDMKGKDYRRVRGQINFLGENLTIREFCEMHGLECTVKEPQFHIRPARPDETGIFYAQHPADECRGDHSVEGVSELLLTLLIDNGGCPASLADHICQEDVVYG